jgi:hypothetical protein
MKKLLAIILFLSAFNAFAQNTVTLPGGTNPSTISVRTKFLDSLHQTWINFPGIGWNQFYSATEANLRFATLTGLSSYKLKNDTVNADGYVTNWKYNGTTPSGTNYGMYKNASNQLVSTGAHGYVAALNRFFFSARTDFTSGLRSDQVPTTGNEVLRLADSTIYATPYSLSTNYWKLTGGNDATGLQNISDGSNHGLTLGYASVYGGLWFKDVTSKFLSNTAFYGNSSLTALNVGTGGTVEVGVAGGGQIQVSNDTTYMLNNVKISNAPTANGMPLRYQEGLTYLPKADSGNVANNYVSYGKYISGVNTLYNKTFVAPVLGDGLHTSLTGPLLIGGTGTTSTLSLQTTTGVGATGADMIFKGGDNGATEFMRILNNGRIGIGTSSPQHFVDAQYPGGIIMQVRNTLTNVDARFRARNTLYEMDFGAESDGGYVSLGSGVGVVKFINSPAGGEAFRISAANRILIATTTDDGGNKLQVNGGASATTVTSPLIVGGTTTTSPLTFKTTTGNATTGADFIWQGGNNGGTELMRVLANGRVGIGIAVPTQRLEVSTAGASMVLNRNTASTADARFRVQNTSFTGDLGVDATGMYYQAAGTSPTIRFINNTEVFRINASNNLLLGASSATAGAPKLDVTGSIGSTALSLSQLVATDANKVLVSVTELPSGTTAAAPSNPNEVARLADITALSVSSGTYTPTITNGSNVTANTPRVCQYTRVGNIVTVSGRVDLTVTSASTNTDINISLPIPSNIGTIYELNGVAQGSSSTGGIVNDATLIGSPGPDEALLSFISGSGTTPVIHFTFTYQVI